MAEDLKLTMPVLKLLRAMLGNPSGEHYGFEMMQASGLASGTLYPALRRLEGAGWITGAWETAVEGRPPRRYYTLTTSGAERARLAVAEARAALGPSAPRVRLRPAGRLT